MSTLLVLQHIACELPAPHQNEIRDRGVSLHRLQIDEGQPLPDWREFAGIVAMGGPVGTLHWPEGLARSC